MNKREEHTAVTQKRGARFASARQLRARNRRLLAVLGCIAVLATAFALMLPALSMTRGALVCDLEEHTHTKACYEQILVCGQEEGEGADPETGEGGHVHTKECYEKQLACGKAEHKHTDACYEQAMSAESADKGEGDSASGAADSNAGEAGNGADLQDVAGDGSGSDADGSSGETDAADQSASSESASSVGALEPGAEADMPAQSFKADLKDAKGKVTLTVEVEAPQGAFPAGTFMKIDGVAASKIEGAVEKAVAKKTDGKVTKIQAVDITFREGDAEGKEIEPARDITVKLTSKLIAETEKPLVVHVDDKGKADVVDTLTKKQLKKRDLKAEDDQLLFDADKFSTYGIVITTLEQTLTASDGNNYTVTVTAPAEAGVPEDAELVVREIVEAEGATDGATEYEDYVARTEEALGWEAGSARSARVFDIKIVDAKGDKVEIAAPVSVAIELSGKDEGEGARQNTQVVHFADDSGTGDVVQNVDANDDIVSFEAEGFSAYAIVEGPEAMPLGWMKVTSIEELASLGAQGLYLGHTSGFYFMNTLKGDSSRTGITKTKPAQSYPPTERAALYFFEQVEGSSNLFYAYCYAADGTTKQYVKNAGNNSLSFTTEDDKTAFTAKVDSSGQFTMNNGPWYWNMQGGANGERFCAFNTVNDPNNKMYFWYYTFADQDPYGLDGKSYGLMNWNGGAAGKAMMASSTNEGALDAKALTVMAKQTNNEDKLFVPNDSDISMWTFKWVEDDKYYLKADVDGSVKYLKIDSNGPSLASEPDNSCKIQVIPGTGVHAGEVCLKSGNTTLTYSGSMETGFSTGADAGNEWLHFVELSELTPDYFMTYSASKVSVSDTEKVGNGSRIIVYTRTWNQAKERYDFYAIGGDGELVPVYESGDSIQWVGGQLNTLLWNLVEHRDPVTDEINYYYELYNQYSENYIAPQVADGQVLSDDPIGINLNGRRNGQYYTTVLAWDEDNYAYAGLKVENGRIVSCPKSEADDFYFAIMEDIPVDDELSTVPTVDHTEYGVTMKMYDFKTRAQMSNFLNNDEGGAVTTTVPNLLSTDLGSDRYPTAHGGSLSNLFNAAETKTGDVNHLFIQSIYDGSGYFEFDSSQNFASLDSDKNFKVYKELGSYDGGQNKNTLKHGQFFPFNDIEPGSFTSLNKQNLYSATGQKLLDTDPRKYEKLYSIEHDGQKADCFFAMELEASFMQTPNGKDAWGHDIIFEFTGDDDFWLYVDGELVIDLGGIHSALPGSVNFSTGIVNVNGTQTTLREVFYNNYKSRNHTDAEAEAYVESIFEQNEAGQFVFKDNTSHTMRIFFMERGAGASNLHMRFNLASVKPGTFELAKKLEGVDESESALAEFPYQVWYKTLQKDGNGEPVLDGNGNPIEEEHQLTQSGQEAKAHYKDTITPVTYKPSLVIHDDGGDLTYGDVYMLKPGEIAVFNLPEDAVSYKVVECGLNADVYESVKVEDTSISGTDASGGTNRKDYATDYEATQSRPRVTYANEVNPNALRTLTVSKKLYDETGQTELMDDPARFDFRLSLGTEFEDGLTLADMYTYHVKDGEGNYCKWDVDQKQFASIGKKVYSQLTPEEKKLVSFTTSMNGSISKIPATYTVELREVLAGTRFKAEEWDSEIPDGYSRQKYVFYENWTEPGAGGSNSSSGGESSAPPEGIIQAGKDPHVDVCNLKGWGLRVNKVWTDADYMSDRAPTYFAVFVDHNENHGNGHGDGNITLVDGTVRQLKYSDNPQTLYWYFEHLPDTSVTDLGKYIIREVWLTSDTPTVDENGVVTNFGNAHPIHDEAQMSLSGKQKGESQSSNFDYTVHYDSGTVETGSNVRVDTVTNDRPGIVLKKTKWDGTTALPGATFTLKDDGGNEIGTFTSDDEGLITTAFLRTNVDYTLTETKTPQGYRGLESPLTIELRGNHDLAISGVPEGWYDLSHGHPPVLTIKDAPYTFQAIKKDGDTDNPLQGVTFALYHKKTVDQVTTYELMTGYGALESTSDGIIPKLDNTLPAGDYELRETWAPSGYQTLSSHTYFTISSTGTITLGNYPYGVELSETQKGDGAIAYELVIKNTQRRIISFKKVDITSPSSSALEGAEFDLYQVIDEQQQESALYTGLKSGNDGMLAETTGASAGNKLFDLPIGTYHLVETKAPDGYNMHTEPIVVIVTANANENGVTYDDGTSLSRSNEGREYNSATKVFTLKISNSAGVELPMTGGMGTWPLYLLGIGLVLLAGGMLVARRRPLAVLSRELAYTRARNKLGRRVYQHKGFTRIVATRRNHRRPR